MKEDWKKGNESQMTSIQRMIEHERWLKQQHQEVKDKILQRNKPDDTDQTLIQGFPKD